MMFSYLTDPGVGLFVLFAWALTAAFVLHDISKYSDKAWAKINESKLVWQVVGSALAWPVGAVVYFLALRPRLEALVEEDRKERWMQEYEARQAAATQGVAATGDNPAAPTSAAVQPQPVAAPTASTESYGTWVDSSDEVPATAESSVGTEEPATVPGSDGVHDKEKDN